MGIFQITNQISPNISGSVIMFKSIHVIQMKPTMASKKCPYCGNILDDDGSCSKGCQ